MPTPPSLKITKEMGWRGGVRRWSNRYHFNGGTPGSETAWTTLADAVTAAEKLAIPDYRGTKIVEATGYVGGSEVHVFQKTYSLNGTLATTGKHTTPGECAALVRWNTAARSTKNHPIYCFAYMHDPVYDSAAAPDVLSPAMKTALETYATAWITGFSDGSHTCVRATPRGEGATSRTVDTYITHRDFPA